MNKIKLAAVAVAGTAALAVGGGLASAAVTFDPGTGTGFVGKGDVQLVYGWNNKALQDNANSVQFRANSTEVSEVSWTCTKDNSNTQERERTTTTNIQGVVSSVARERNQITGFNLTGYSGGVTESSSTEGPKLNSCPNFWELTSPAGEPEVVSSTSSLEVSNDGSTWQAIG